MENGQLTWITNFIWGIADDVLRDLYVRGKYRDVILPMTVIRRLDAVLEPTKQAVLDMKASLDKAGITNQDAALRQAAGQAFYNTSKFTLRDLKARASRQQLEADFRSYLDGFSPNVQEIIDNFEFRNQIPRLAKADALVLPYPQEDEVHDLIPNPEVERIAMETAMEYECRRGWLPEDVSAENRGFDIISCHPENGHVRFIEVKGRATAGAIALTLNEYKTAERLRGDYWLYVVLDCSTKPRLLRIHIRPYLHAFLY